MNWSLWKWLFTVSKKELSQFGNLHEFILKKKKNNLSFHMFLMTFKLACFRVTLSCMLWSSRHHTAYAFYLGNPRSAPQLARTAAPSWPRDGVAGHCRPPTSLHRRSYPKKFPGSEYLAPLTQSEHHHWDKPAPLRHRSAWWGGSGSKIGLQREGKRVSGPVSGA